MDEAVDAEEAKDDEDSADEAEPHGSFRRDRIGPRRRSRLPSRHAESSIGGTIRSLVGVVLGGVIGIGGGLLILKAAYSQATSSVRRFRSRTSRPICPSDLAQRGRRPSPRRRRASRSICAPRRDGHLDRASAHRSPDQPAARPRRPRSDHSTATGESTAGREPKTPKPPKLPPGGRDRCDGTPEPLHAPGAHRGRRNQDPADDRRRGEGRRCSATVADVSQGAWPRLRRASPPARRAPSPSTPCSTINWPRSAKLSPSGAG